MTNRKKTLGVLLFLAIYAAVAIIGFLIVFLVKGYVGKPAATTVVPKSTPAPIPTGFKTYENKAQKFEVSYPSELKKTETSHGFGVNTIELRSPENQEPTYAADIQILTVPKMLAKTIGQDFDTYYAMPDGTTTTIASPLGESKSAEQFTKVRNREVQGLRALDYSSVPSPNPNNNEAEIGVFIEKGNDMIIVAGSKSNRDQLEEVLKTFSATP